MIKKIYLSYVINNDTPTYGNRNTFQIEKKSSIANGDVANDSFIKTTVHIGTHIDMPYHFYENGQTIEDFDIDYFYFKNVLFLELNSNNLVIKDELISLLKKQADKDKYDSIIVKTGICYKREEEVFWRENYGFHPDITYYIRESFPKVRIFGFDSISVSSYSDRMTGREAHKAFLNPIHPILLVEDMDLTQIDKNTKIESLVVFPLRIRKSDGIPCTIVAEIEE